MRYIIYGAGAVGGTIGARLHLAGKEVVLIARGRHLLALKDNGLTFMTPEGTSTLRIDAVAGPTEIAFRPDDAVFLCMKSQDTTGALDALRDAAGDAVAVVCTQNGVANERMALRRFENVYAMVVMLPATHLEPGVVQAESAPTFGVLDAGRFPSGTDDVITRVCADLETARFSAHPDPKVMRYKYTKLLSNLDNALQAACGAGPHTANLHGLARAEAIACYEAAGIECAPDDEWRARRADNIRVLPVAGGMRAGGSSWQSLQRGTGSIEADYLNGEIVLLGRLHGIPTPVNRLLQVTANRLARIGAKPGSVRAEDLEAQLA